MTRIRHRKIADWETKIQGIQAEQTVINRSDGYQETDRQTQ